MDVLKKEIKNHILHLTLNRADKHNAMNAAIIAGLKEAFAETRKLENLKAVYLSGKGKSFCAGADFNWMKQAKDFTLAQNRADSKTLADMYEAGFRCPVPIVCSVQGNVMGGGLGLVSIADVVAADDNTRFCFSEVKLGLVPSVIAPYVLRKIDESAALSLMVTAANFTSAQAHNIGLVHFTGNTKACANFVDEQLKLLGDNAPEAVRVTKQLLRRLKRLSWPEARRLTIETISKRRVSKEAQEGMQAFMEKRPPSWRAS